VVRKTIPAHRPEGTNIEIWRVVLIKEVKDKNDKIFGDFRLADIDDIDFGGDLPKHGLSLG
jgi:hypothetical protein